MRWAAIILAALGIAAQAAWAQPVPRPRPSPDALPAPAEPIQAPARQAEGALSRCAELDHPEWGENERWAWAKLCDGEVADFNRRAGDGAERLNPRDAKAWTAERQLHPRFLPTILYAEPYRSFIPRAGARIAGAWIAEPVDLKGGRAEVPLALDRSRLDGALDLSDARFAAYLSFTGSVLTKPLSLARARIDGQLALTDTRIEGALALQGARLFELAVEASAIGGALDLTGAEVEGRLLLKDSRVDGRMSLAGARIHGAALFDRATLWDEADFSNLEAAIDLAFKNGARVNGRLALAGAKIEGQIEANGAAFGGPLATEGLVVSGSILMRGASFARPAAIVGATIGKDLDLSGTRLAGLDLTDTRIAGALRFGTNGTAPIWGDGARLTLARAEVGALSGAFALPPDGATGRAPWPPKGGVDVGDFAVGRFADPALGEETPTVAGLSAFLALDAQAPLGAYRTLADALGAADRVRDAQAMLYAGRERARAQAWEDGRLLAYAGLSLLDLTVGYGIGWGGLRLTLWAALLSVLGALVLQRAPGLRDRGPFWQLYASFDQLLPLISLDRGHDEAIARELSDGGRLYFRLHQFAGWGLFALLLAALLGLTQS